MKNNTEKEKTVKRSRQAPENDSMIELGASEENLYGKSRTGIQIIKVLRAQAPLLIQ